MDPSTTDLVAPLRSSASYRSALLIALLLLALQVLATLLIYPFLPHTVASHSDIHGQVNSPTWVYLIILPAISVGLYIFFYFLLRLVTVLEPKSRYRRNRNLSQEQIIRQVRLGLAIPKFILIGLQLLFLAIQILLLLLALFRAGHPGA